MLSESVRITSVEPGFLLLQPYNTATCGSCSLKPSCGQYILNSLHAERALKFPVALLTGNIDLDELKNGTHAQIKIAAGKLVQLSLLLYMLPLLLVLTSTLFSALAGFNELTTVVLAFITLLLSFTILHNYMENHLSADNIKVRLVIDS